MERVKGESRRAEEMSLKEKKNRSNKSQIVQKNTRDRTTYLEVKLRKKKLCKKRWCEG